MRRLSSVLLLFFLLPLNLAAQTEDAKLMKFLDDEWEWQMREFPTQATSAGDPRYNDRMVDPAEVGVFARERRHEWKAPPIFLGSSAR